MIQKVVFPKNIDDPKSDQNIDNKENKQSN